MLIEFSGIPASGKSTLIGMLAAGGTVNGWKLERTAPPSGARMPRYVTRHPDRRVLFQASRFRAAHAPFFAESDRLCGDVALDGFFFSLTAQVYQDWRDEEPPGRALLLDEGFVGRSAALAATRDEDVTSLARLAPLPDILVMADAAPDAAFDRATRRHGDPAKMRKAVIALHGDEAMFARRRAALVTACDIAQERGAPVLRVDTGQPPDVAAAQLRRLISECLSERPNRPDDGPRSGRA